MTAKPVVNIKKELYKKIDEYAKKFQQETGVKMIAFPDIAFETVLLENLREDVKEYTGHDPCTRSRKHEIVEAKVFFTQVAVMLGYSPIEICRHLMGDRSNIYHYDTYHAAHMGSSVEYRNKFNRFIKRYHDKQRQEIGMGV